MNEAVALIYSLHDILAHIPANYFIVCLQIMLTFLSYRHEQPMSLFSRGGNLAPTENAFPLWRSSQRLHSGGYSSQAWAMHACTRSYSHMCAALRGRASLISNDSRNF